MKKKNLILETLELPISLEPFGLSQGKKIHM